MATSNFQFNVNGTVFNLTLTFAGVATSGQATAISGTAGPHTVTGLSTYLQADNVMSATQPFVNADGLSFTTSGTAIHPVTGATIALAYNIYANGGNYLVTGNDDVFSNEPTDSISYIEGPSNTPPVLDHNLGSTVAEGGSDTVTSAELEFNDTEQADGAITYLVTSAATNGTLFRNGVALTTSSTFTQADINANLITFTHNGGETTGASFGFSVSDGAGGNVTNQTFSFTVTPVNDPPSVQNPPPAVITVTEDVQADIELGNFNFGDPDSDSGTVTLIIQASAGTLFATSGGGVTVANSGTNTITFSGTMVALNAFIGTGLADVSYRTAANASGVNVATLTYSITDNGNTGAGGGGIITLGTSQIDATAVEDPGVAEDDVFSITESAAIGGAGANLFNANGGLVDSDPDGALSIIAVAGGTVGTQFTLASGALLTVNANGTFAYDPNGAFNALPGPASGASNITATDSFTYTVGGGDTATVTITITGESSDLDILLGTAGVDTMIGGANRDLFRGSLGGDVIIGQGGIDYISYAGSAAGVTVNLTTNVNLGGDAEGDTLVSIDHVTGSVFADDITGNGGSNHLDGGAGADTLRGLGGSDFYFVDDALDLVVEDAVPGADTVIATVSFVLGANLERLALRGTDDLDGTGNGLANLITGNDGANILTGLGGNDALLGGAGEDTLDGGEGSDRLTGGADADIFVFSAASDTRAGVLRDRILDFVTGEDMIDLSAIDADIRAGSPNDQAFDFIGGARFSGAAHEIRVQTILGQTVIQGDIDGDRRTDFEIGLAGFAGTLTVGDFIL